MNSAPPTLALLALGCAVLVAHASGCGGDDEPAADAGPVDTGVAAETSADTAGAGDATMTAPTCTTDGECAAGGTCLLAEGRCLPAGAATVVPSGANATPAIESAPAGAHTIVLRGAVPGFTVSRAGEAPLTIIGDGAVVTPAPGGKAGIRVESGQVVLQGLELRVPASAIGIDVDGPADVTLDRVRLGGDGGRGGVAVRVNGARFFRMDRSIVVGTGGVLVQPGGGLSITNSVFDDNDGPLGAVVLYPQKSPDPKGHRFVGNTVIRSRFYGVGCIDGYQWILRSVLLSANQQDTSPSCHLSASHSGAVTFDPARPYHLPPGTTCCIDKGDPDDVPPHDLDGEPRPAGGRPDIGADEAR